VNLSGVTIVGNTSTYLGGGIYITSSGLAGIKNASFYGNSAPDLGGGIYTDGATNLTNVTLTHNWVYGLAAASTFSAGRTT
jgi:predicted outer membrane repeat protein